MYDSTAFAVGVTALRLIFDSRRYTGSAHNLWRASCQNTPIPKTSHAFEVMSKRRKGFPSETNVKRGYRTIKGGDVELNEKLGRNDPCPCGSGHRFQEVLHEVGPL